MNGTKKMGCAEAYNQDSYDFIIDKEETYRGITPIEPDCISSIGNRFEIWYTPKARVVSLNSYNYPYQNIPGIYSLLDTAYKEEACITQVLNQESLALDGEDVIIGMIDTGLDLRDEAFQFTGGGTRVGIYWDQEEEGQSRDGEEESSYENPDYTGYGRVYTREEINQRLIDNQELPRDSIGHGSILAGIMASSVDGIARSAELAVVKLKPCKQYLREYYSVSDSAIVYQENDIMAGVAFLTNYADEVEKPLVISIALGTNMGNHMGGSYLAQMLSGVMNSPRKMVVCGAGNEALFRHHFKGSIPNSGGIEEVEVQVSQGVEGFWIESWCLIPQFLTMDVISPSGEIMQSVRANLYGEKSYRFNLENTLVIQTVSVVVSEEGQQLIQVRMINPVAGIWKLRIRGGVVTTGDYHLWLPMEEQLNGTVVFVRSNPDTTVTEPGNGRALLTMGGYDGDTGGIFIQSGRGYTASNQIKPELAAPAVNLVSPYRGNIITGTSGAVAVAAGACALYMQWVVYRRGGPEIVGTVLKYGLELGAKKEERYSYPNKEWGFGSLCLYDTLRL